MTRMDVRLQAWPWSTRKAASVAGRTDDQVIGMQKRQVPDSELASWMFGEAAPGVVAENRAMLGPGGDIPVRGCRRSGAGGDPSRSGQAVL